MLARGTLISILFATSAFALPDEGIRLSATRQASQDVQLDWIGGSPVYHVYRSTIASDVTAAGNELGQSSAKQWLDSPPAGTLYFYRVLGVMTPCTSDAQCASAEYCGATAVCLPDQDNGMTCAGDSQCGSAHCANGFCCASGDCCASSVDCAAYGQPAVCNTPSACQGTRAYGVCTAYTCGTLTLDDDSGCGSGVQSQACGAYPSVFCTGVASQTAPVCPASCADDSGCDANAHCDASACLLDLPAGSACDENSDCTTANCADGVCCDSACGATCTACNLTGSVGTCTPIPDGADPDAECGAVSCSNYYWGWVGDTCYGKSDVSAAQATCGGDSACRTQSEECGASSTQGSAAVTCNALCQDPVPATCSGTTAGACVNVNPGNQTCGFGPCQVTTLRCSGGAPVTCVPNSGASTTETCNGVDDNCDGTIDNGAFQDGLEPDDSCAQVRTLAGVGSDGTHTESGPTLYGPGDTDYYQFTATETDSSCYCGFPFLDEDYDLTTTLTVPPGAGSYELCMGTVCGTWTSCITVAGGSSDSILLLLDGSCTATDAYTYFLRIRGVSGAASSCHAYSLSYFFDAGYCR
jgi:hypothetical protein